MFRRKTVFILGAGASCHYGYPTGEELVHKVKERCETAASFFGNSHSYANAPDFVLRRSGGGRATRPAYERAMRDCAQLKDRLSQLNPLVIDYFLAHNSSLVDVGRLMIAWVILECESRYESSGRRNLNRTPPRDPHKDDWYKKFLLHRLTFDLESSSDLLDNEVTFVTFNYDVSLDYFLYRTLNAIETLEHSHVEQFLSGRVIHMYGSVRGLPCKDIQPLDFSHFRHRFANQNDPPYVVAKTVIDEVYQSSQNLRVIDPHEKDLSDETTVLARRAISEAEVIYILGYGFDRKNSHRLGLAETLYNLPT